MYKILIKSKIFLDDFLKKEILHYTSKKLTHLSNSLYELEFTNEKELIDVISNLAFYSRTIENIYLKIITFDNIKKVSLSPKDLSFIKKDFSFEIDSLKSFEGDREKAEKLFGKLCLENSNKLKVNLTSPDLSFKLFTIDKISFLVLDLIGFKLSKRDFKINFNSSSINSLIPNYCFYLLGMDKEKSFSIIDPFANLGDIAIEASIFNPRVPLNVQKKESFPISKLFSISFPFPKVSKKNNNKIIAIVQNNKVFKEIKENISFSSQKIKVSQYDLDFLDVKFKKDQVDYVISQLPSNLEDGDFAEVQREFFYMAEFIFKKAICIISKKKIYPKILKKFKLKINFYSEIFIGEQQYYIYLIGK